MSESLIIGANLTGTQRFHGVAEGSVDFEGAPLVVAPREANPTRPTLGRLQRGFYKEVEVARW